MEAKINPVGTIQQLDVVENKITYFQETWRKSKEKYNVTIALIFTFLLSALDELIEVIDDVLRSGPDKKATVLNAIDRLFDFIIKEGIPIWLKPFIYLFKYYIVYFLISMFLDWLVARYRSKQNQGGNNE